jgi:hypothetical protein
MSRIWVQVLAALSAGTVGLLLLWWLSPKASHNDPNSPPTERRSGLAHDSAGLLSSELPGVLLEQELGELRAVRPRLKRQAGADREQLTAYEEQLGAKRRALYFFGGRPARLARVQIATQLAQVDAIVERVLSLQQRLGPPAGVWDCPATGGQLPTRRYSYQHGKAAAVDVFAIVGESALATYYVTSRQQLRASLALADCSPTPPERAARFPALPPVR